MSTASAVAPKTAQADPLLGLSKETLRKWYDEMLLIRRFEEKAAQLYGMGKIGGFCHLYNGQEAVSTGSLGALTPEDYVITAYRDHGLAISKGLDPKSLMAELLGKHTGTTKGKGGSMHFFDSSKNFLGGHAIVGSQLPIGAGVAFAIKYREEKRVILCFMGDGATNIGTFHEALNLSALWKLPIVYIIENNKYSMGTSVERSSSMVDLHKKALAYGMRNGWVDGHDVFAVYNAVKDAVDLARQSCEPTLLEMRTFRYRGHSMSDPVHGHYRSKEEVEQIKKLDPIELLASILKTHGVVDDRFLDETEKRVKAQVEETVAFAQNSPEPPLSELYTDVYKESPGEM